MGAVDKSTHGARNPEEEQRTLAVSPTNTQNSVRVQEGG